MHYFFSNDLYSGVYEGMDSISRVFAAMLGDIPVEDGKVAPPPRPRRRAHAPQQGVALVAKLLSW